MKPIAISIAVSIIVFAIPGRHSHGHAGRTDANGGHHDRKNGGYHYHSGGPAAHKPSEGDLDSTSSNVKSESRTTASVTPRLTARTYARTEVPKPTRFAMTTETKESSELSEELKAFTAKQSALSKRPIKWEFHVTYSKPVQVFDFVDNDKYWRAEVKSGSTNNIRKEEVVRIEPLIDPRDLRSWWDKTGKFSTVARYLDFHNGELQIRTIAGKAISLPMDRLSDVDVKHLEKINRYLKEHGE